MKKSYSLLCIIIILLGQLILPISAAAETTTSYSETIDTWMPDKNLQKAVAEKYNVDVDHLTKEILENNQESYVDLMLTDDLNTASDSGRYYVENLKGLEYISGMLTVDISLYHTTNTFMSIDQSYFLNIKNNSKRNHTIFNENYNSEFTNFSLFWDYLNDDNAYSSFSLADSQSINRTTNLRLETTIDDYRNIVLPISNFYQKGTPFSESYSGAILSIDPLEAVWDNDFDTTEEAENPLNFLDYVYVSQENIKLVYAIYLENDNLVFKLKKGDINLSDIDLDEPLSTSLSLYHMLIPTRSLLGNYRFSTQLNTDIYLKKPIEIGENVTIQYQDTEGNTLAPNEVKSGNVGDTYTSEKLTIDGYTFKEIKGAASGTFTTEPQTVTYVYTKDPVKGAEVTVQYQDTEGNTIAPNVIKAGNVGEAYTSEKLTIEGYTFKEIKGTASGTFTAEPQTVTYVYTKDPVKGAEVTVQYQDTEGNTLAPNEVKSGNVGDTYTSEKLTIDGYTFKEIKGAASGTFTTEPQTVTYVYTKDPVKGAEVTVQYQDTEGNTIAPNVIKAGNVGEAYTSEKLTIEGYTFKEIKGTASGTFTAEPQTVTYVYTKDPVKGAEVTVQYQDTEGNTIAPNVIKAGNVGEAYTSEKLTIEGYTFKEIKGTASGTFTAEPQTVTYVYTKDPVKGAEVTVQYQDTEGNTIAPNVIKAGNVGEAYTSEKLTIEGYTFKEIKGTASGTFTAEPQTVTYVYTKDPVKGAEVTVQYQDTEGNTIAPNVIKAGNVGEAYTSEKLTIEGYTFKEIKGTASGTFTAEPQTVTYVYTKDPVKGAEVTVQYQDTEGNTIAPNVIKAGNVGEAYTSEKLTIEGYTFKEIKGTASGTFTAEPQTVTYVYTKDPVKGAEVTVQYQDTEGNTIAPNVIKAGNVGEAYTSEKLTIEGYTFKEIKGTASGTFTAEPQTVTYVYTKDPVKGAEVTVQYQDTEGNTIAPNVVKSGNVGEAYTSEKLTIDGYLFKEVKGNASGSFTADPQTVTYVYTDKQIPSVTPTDNNLIKNIPINSKSTMKLLPQTGESKTILFTLLGGIILIIGIYIFISRPKKIR